MKTWILYFIWFKTSSHVVQCLISTPDDHCINFQYLSIMAFVIPSFHVFLGPSLSSSRRYPFHSYPYQFNCFFSVSVVRDTSIPIRSFTSGIFFFISVSSFPVLLSIIPINIKWKKLWSKVGGPPRMTSNNVMQHGRISENALLWSGIL